MTIAPSGPRLLGLGDNTVDTYVDANLQFPGGNAVNVAVLAHRLGLRAAYLGCLGTDAGGDLIAAALEGEGIETDRMRRVPGANARAFIRHDGGDRRFLRGEPGVRGRYDFTDADFAYIAGFNAVHTSIFSELDGDLPRIRAAAAQLSYDFSERWNDAVFARVLPLIDIAFLSAPNRADADVAALLRDCATAGPRLVVATRGPQGAMACAEGAILTQGIAPATVVDTLGAGDGFIAACLTGLLRGAELASALEQGAGFAAAVVGWQGAFGHGAPWDEIFSG